MSETSLDAGSRASSAMPSSMSKHCYLKPCDWEPCANLQNVCNNAIGKLKTSISKVVPKTRLQLISLQKCILSKFISSQTPPPRQTVNYWRKSCSLGKEKHQTQLQKMCTQHTGRVDGITKNVDKCHGEYLGFNYTSTQICINNSFIQVFICLLKWCTHPNNGKVYQ